MGILALNTPVASHINDYVARLIVATHPDSPDAPDMVRQFVRYGSSPRGAQALIIGAKVHALLEGRFNVSFEDIYGDSAALAAAPAAAQLRGHGRGHRHGCYYPRPAQNRRQAAGVMRGSDASKAGIAICKCCADADIRLACRCCFALCAIAPGKEET